MWFLQFFPSAIIHILLITSVVGLLAATILKTIPFLVQYRLSIQFGSSILLLFSMFMEGALTNNMVWKVKLATAEQKVKEAELAAANATAQIQYVYVDKIKTVTEIKYINRDRIKTISKVIDSQCRISNDALQVLNDAASNKVGAIK